MIDNGANIAINSIDIVGFGNIFLFGLVWGGRVLPSNIFINYLRRYRVLNIRLIWSYAKTAIIALVIGFIILFFIGCKSFYEEKMLGCMGKSKSHVEGEFGEFTKCKPTEIGEVCIIYTHPKFNEVWAYFDASGNCYKITTR